jgi:two-component system, LytTR family, response regulator LytT
MKIVIIEDEKLTAKDLQKTIKSIEPNAEIIIILGSIEESVEYFATEPDVDLIFSDIQLGDGNSFEIFENSTIRIPIIFCTAFNDYALRAFDTFGIDYILKPFSAKTIEKALTKFKTITKQKQTYTNDLKTIFESISKQIQPNKLPNIIIHQGDKIIPIGGDNIALFYIDSSVVKAILFDDKPCVVSYNLEDLEVKFAPYFYRVNRQFLVNRSAVKEASQHFNRKLLVHLNIPFADEILVTKEKVTPFLEWLAQF